MLKKNDQIIVSELILLGFVVVLISYIPKIRIESNIGQHIKDVCWEGGLMNKEGYKNSKWADMDFYKSCLMNATCTSPLQKCEIEEP